MTSTTTRQIIQRADLFMPSSMLHDSLQLKNPIIETCWSSIEQINSGGKILNAIGCNDDQIAAGDSITTPGLE